MRSMLLMSLATMAFAVDPTFVEVYGFGVSHHNDRNVDYNERNYGIGLGLEKRVGDDTGGDGHGGFTLVGGIYKDSFNETAKFLMPGMRFSVGDDKGLHGSLGLNLGYFEGSGFKGIGGMGMISIGVNWFDMCMVGVPGKSQNTNPSRDPKDHKKDSVGFVAFFIKLRVLTF